MANHLDSISLPDLTKIPDTWTGIRATKTFSIGGHPIVWEGSIYGKSYDLVGGADYGWMLLSDIKNLIALASVKNATYELEFNGEIKTVRFRNEDGDPIEYTPVINYSDIENSDKCNNIVIKLMEV